MEAPAAIAAILVTSGSETSIPAASAFAEPLWLELKLVDVAVCVTVVIEVGTVDESEADAVVG